jgi:glycerol-3-phosphate dehydrogenase (NAD(P)+)
MSEKIGVIGAGAWGTALAKVLAECGHRVAIWCNEAETAAGIRNEGRNERFLPGVALPRGIGADTDALAVATGKDVIVLAVPSPYLMGVVRRILSAPNVMDGESLFVVVTKGFIPGRDGPSGRAAPKLILETLEDHLPGFYRGNTVYLSGPSHAEEVSRGMITGLAAASQNGRSAIRARELFRGSRVLVFPSLDTVGVQVCAAAKNVVAIAFGMLDAIAAHGGGERGAPEFGDNTESLLLAAGLNEMQSLGTALGATHPETFTSIAGVGDLDVTCRSVHGRNRRFGREIVEKGVLASFRDLDDLLARIGELGYLPEGAVACKQIHAIAAERKLELPIMGGVHGILDRKAEPLAFLEDYLAAMGAAPVK